MEEKELIDGLVERVHREFPEIKVKFTNSERGELNTKDGKQVITIGKEGSSGEHPYLTLLHEIGHYVTHGSVNKEKYFEGYDTKDCSASNTIYNSKIVLMAEIDAWVWAYGECPSELKKTMLEYAVYCLSSYWVVSETMTGLNVKNFFEHEGMSRIKYPPEKSNSANKKRDEFKLFMASFFGLKRPDPKICEKPITNCIVKRAENNLFFDENC